MQDRLSWIRQWNSVVTSLKEDRMFKDQHSDQYLWNDDGEQYYIDEARATDYAKQKPKTGIFGNMLG